MLGSSIKFCITGITIDVEVLNHMKLTKYKFSLLQQESINVFYLEEGLLLVHVSLFAPGNNFPTDHTEDIGCNFVFTDRVKYLNSFFMISLSPLPIQRSESCFVIFLSTSMAHLRKIYKAKELTQSGETGNQNINFQIHRTYL